MPTTHPKVIKGLSISCMALCAIALVAYVVLAVSAFLIVGAMEMYQSTSNGTIHNLHLNIPGGVSASYGHGLGDGYGYSYDNPYIKHYGTPDEVIGAAALTVGAAALAIVAVFQAVAFIASIIAFRNAGNPNKLGLVFGWSIVGAIFSLLSVGIGACVVFVMIAVFARKDRNALANAVVYVQTEYVGPATGSAGVDSYGNPVGGSDHNGKQ